MAAFNMPPMPQFNPAEMQGLPGYGQQPQGFPQQAPYGGDPNFPQGAPAGLGLQPAQDANALAQYGQAAPVNQAQYAPQPQQQFTQPQFPGLVGGFPAPEAAPQPEQAEAPAKKKGGSRSKKAGDDAPAATPVVDVIESAYCTIDVKLSNFPVGMLPHLQAALNSWGIV